MIALIELSDARFDRHIWINADAITFMTEATSQSPSGTGAVFHLQDSSTTWEVEETPEEIIALARRALAQRVLA